MSFKETPVERIDEEEYLAINGAGFNSMGDAHYHAHRCKSERTWKSVLEIQRKQDVDVMVQRARLREEYREKVQRGEIVPPSLIDRANGPENLEATQAARRLCRKRGIDWTKRGTP